MASGVTPIVDFNVALVAVGDPMRVMILMDQAVGRADERGGKHAAKEVVHYAKQYAGQFSPSNTRSYTLTDQPLVKTIKAVKTGGGRSGKGLGNYAVEVSAPHAKFVEYGTRYMQAQPFLRPAFEEANLGDIFHNAIWNDPELKLARNTPVIYDLSTQGRLFGAGKGLSSLSPAALSTGAFTGKFNMSGSTSNVWTPETFFRNLNL